MRPLSHSQKIHAWKPPEQSAGPPARQQRDRPDRTTSGMAPHPAITGQFARLFRSALFIAAVLPLNGTRWPFADHLYGQFAMRILRMTDLKLRLALRVVVLSACRFA